MSHKHSHAIHGAFPVKPQNPSVVAGALRLWWRRLEAATTPPCVQQGKHDRHSECDECQAW
jgi:hypothetical protein